MAGKTQRNKKTTPSAAPKPRRRAQAAAKTAAPVFRTGTWAALILLAALIVFAIFLNKKKEAASAAATPTAGITYVFTETDGSTSGIEIKSSDGQSVKVEKGADGAWTLTQPLEAAADQGSAQAAMDQIRTLQLQGELDKVALDILGLDHPAYTITITFDGGKQRILEIGAVTPTNSGYYCRLDGNRLVILNKTNVDALLNLLKAPPYRETPTPSPLPPTETPAAVIEATPTPTP
jgi:hypothetical protein